MKTGIYIKLTTRKVVAENGTSKIPLPFAKSINGFGTRLSAGAVRKK